LWNDSADSGTSKKEIAKATHFSNHRVLKVLKACIERGCVVQISGGRSTRYALTKQGRAKHDLFVTIRKEARCDDYASLGESSRVSSSPREERRRTITETIGIETDSPRLPGASEQAPDAPLGGVPAGGGAIG
jgi:predicted transcriptional regulator